MSRRNSQLEAAIAHLKEADRTLRPVIDRVGPCRLKTSRDRFGSLVRSIVSQQISTKAARAVMARLTAHFGPGPIVADRVQAATAEELRSLGLSRQKASYLHDLAARVSAGSLELRTIGRRNDADVIAELTEVRGIGVWTAQMFLMFTLGRLDVFPGDDLGIRMALKNLYQLDDLPTRQAGEVIAAPWSPYASVASWYCWRSLELSAEA